MKKTPTTTTPPPPSIQGERELPPFPITSVTTEWNETGSWRYLRPRYVELHPACQNGCPTGNDIEAWMLLWERGRLAEAWDAAVLENPFPAIMGRVCFHPCMDGCSRRELGGAINIKALERELADAMSPKLPAPEPFFKPSNKKIAVVGSGPAGLACAYHLTRLGHAVTVFERALKAGGLLRYGIPAYRLPAEIVDREIDRLTRMGIRFELGRAVRDAAALQTLMQDYAAVFLAAGAPKSRAMKVPGERTPGVMSGLEFLQQLACGKEVRVGRRVVVVGGGNTAMDAARAARRQGAEVTVVYRRTQAEMPALPDELTGALEEGVRFEPLLTPVEVTVAQNRVAGLRCQRTMLGEPDESGRRAAVPVPGEEQAFPADTVLVAIGEEIDTSIVPAALHLEGGSVRTLPGGRTERQQLFVGGDFAGNLRTAVHALASGKQSAIAIDCWLRQKDPKEVLAACMIEGKGPALMARYVEGRRGSHPAGPALSGAAREDRVATFADLNAAYFTKAEPAATPELPPSARMGDGASAEILQPLPAEARAQELARCFHCGRCTECDNCYIYCPDVAIAKCLRGFEIDLRYCKGCGVCPAECPRGALAMSEEPME